MTDPRNIAHDKKVQQEKKHRHEAIAPDAEHKPQPGKKPHLHHDAHPSTAANDADAEEGSNTGLTTDSDAEVGERGTS